MTHVSFSGFLSLCPLCAVSWAGVFSTSKREKKKKGGRSKQREGRGERRGSEGQREKGVAKVMKEGLALV